MRLIEHQDINPSAKGSRTWCLPHVGEIPGIKEREHNDILKNLLRWVPERIRWECVRGNLRTQKLHESRWQKTNDPGAHLTTLHDEHGWCCGDTVLFRQEEITLGIDGNNAKLIGVPNRKLVYYWPKGP